MVLQSNIIFDNHYTLIRQLGRGGFSEVWLAHDSYMDLDVAIKIYAPGQGMDSHSIDEFRREITRVFHLNHPNLLKLQHLGIYEQMPYLIMAYCPAGSCISRIGKMTENEVWKLIHDVASGLAYLHEKDIVHQDIKPDNILIDIEGNYLITDFGISTHARSTLRKSVMCSMNSAGTLAYMGPERFSQQPAPTKASDIWSFGAMLFELLEGTTPFPPDFGGSMQNANAVIPTIKAHVSDKLKQTIYKMLSKETWDRPTASMLIELVKSFDKKEDTLIFKEEKNQEKRFKKNIFFIILGIFVFFILIVIVCIIPYKSESEKNIEKDLQYIQEGKIYAKASINSGILYQNEQFTLQIERYGSRNIYYEIIGADCVGEEDVQVREVFTTADYISQYSPLFSDISILNYIPANSNAVTVNFYIDVCYEKIKLNTFIFNIQKVYSKTTEKLSINIDQNRVKRVISDISKYSSKGGDYAKLEYCFTDMISPHPSGEVRYRDNIASTTQNFVEYYPMYEISEPYNFIFVNNSFPLKVECDVNVTWISKKNGKKIRAYIHKIYYITSDYKVSGFVDKEIDRIRL